jgi:hypothetical protein
MKSKLIIYLAFLGLIGLFTSCEKDGDKVVMLADPIAPTIKTLPDLTLTRANGTNTLTFVGTPVDPGFVASANYFLEACVSGTNFADPVTIYNGVKNTEMKITVSDLNGILLKKLPSDQSSAVDFRIRAILVVDAGTGAPGTGSDPMEYISPVVTANVSTYGLPRLDLLNSGMTQKIESALGDGSYFGFVKLDVAQPFTLKDPDANIIYGASGSSLAVNGAGITPAASGWHQLSVNTTALTYSIDPYMIGLVGSATPNGWNSPDQKMDYNPQNGSWNITIDLVVGEIKFRLNDGWAWNLGGTPEKLEHNGANIAIAEAGNYTISMTITNPTPGSEAGTFTIVKN